jgi:hypothetical protein
MTTEKHNLPDAYFNVQQPDVDTIRVSRHDSERYGLEAIVYFGDDVNMHVRTVAKARELLAAAFETLRILDPDGDVDELLAGLLIVPKRAPDLVIPPADELTFRIGDRVVRKDDHSLRGKVVSLGTSPNAVQVKYDARRADESSRFAWELAATIEPAPLTVPPAKADAR